MTRTPHGVEPAEKPGRKVLGPMSYPDAANIMFQLAQMGYPGHYKRYIFDIDWYVEVSIAEMTPELRKKIKKDEVLKTTGLV